MYLLLKYWDLHDLLVLELLYSCSCVLLSLWVMLAIFILLVGYIYSPKGLFNVYVSCTLCDWALYALIYLVMVNIVHVASETKFSRLWFWCMLNFNHQSIFRSWFIGLWLDFYKFIVLSVLFWWDLMNLIVLISYQFNLYLRVVLQ